MMIAQWDRYQNIDLIDKCGMCIITSYRNIVVKYYSIRKKSWSSLEALALQNIFVIPRRSFLKTFIYIQNITINLHCYYLLFKKEVH